mgnify:CR=1 FL=1
MPHIDLSGHLLSYCQLMTVTLFLWMTIMTSMEKDILYIQGG